MFDLEKSIQMFCARKKNLRMRPMPVTDHERTRDLMPPGGFLYLISTSWLRRPYAVRDTAACRLRNPPGASIETRDTLSDVWQLVRVGAGALRPVEAKCGVAAGAGPSQALRIDDFLSVGRGQPVGPCSLLRLTAGGTQPLPHRWP